MSKLLRYAESLEKSNGKNWSQIWIFLLRSVVKSPQQKKKKLQFFVLHLLTPLNVFFAPTFQSPMSKLFWYSECLGKSNKKKWSQIWKFYLKNGVKWLRQKEFFVTGFRHLFTPFKGLLAPTSQSPICKLLRFSESLGKRYGKKWSQIVKLFLIKGLKSQRKKKYFFSANCVLYEFIFTLFCCHLSPVTCHQPPVNCRLSPVTCQPSPSD